ncbi:MAG: hypothetical protein AB1806_00165 [Acidobacteriota bacterium]
MSTATDVLIVSNGYAEDQVAIGLVRALRSRGIDRPIACLPMGMGRPVVTCWGASHVRTRHVVELHTSVALGGHAVVTPPDRRAFGDALAELLDNEPHKQKLSERGLAFMGPHGGLEAIADALQSILGARIAEGS